MTQKLFKSRQHAGALLAEELKNFKNRSDVLVVAIPRGGVPVGYAVAQALGSPLDLCIVRKLGVPGHEELAMGAIASGGSKTYNSSVIQSYSITPETLKRVIAREQQELVRREALYRGSQTTLQCEGKTVILIDDGIATGASIRAAYGALKEHRATQVIIAVPVAPPETCQALQTQYGDQACICYATPERFQGVGQWYEDFHQLEDYEVTEFITKRADEIAKRKSP
jgi:putative phosphoribosyl transferase